MKTKEQIAEEIFATINKTRATKESAIRIMIEAIAEWEAQKWQDIKTAPKDGTRILVYSPKYKESFVVFWGISLDDDSAYWVIANGENTTFVVKDASHWQSLSEIPKK